MGMEYLNEIAAELHNLQEESRGTVHDEKVEKMVSVVLSSVHMIQDLEDRVRALEGKPPQSN
jgi:hypothetical protein